MATDRLAELFKFLEEDPNDPFLYYAVATEYVRQANDAKALEYYQIVRSRFPNYVGTYYHLGKLLERTGKREEAVDVYREGINAANDARDRNALRELKEALTDITGEDE
jgi:tetratricopeptide (TPR) repeat protein